MNQIEIEFVHRLSQDMMDIQEITNLNVICKSIKYYYVDDNNINSYGQKNKLIIYGEVFFDIEYIPIGINEFRYLEITKVISDVINLKRPVFEENNPIKQIIVESSGGRVIDKNTVSINAILNIDI